MKQKEYVHNNKVKLLFLEMKSEKMDLKDFWKFKIRNTMTRMDLEFIIITKYLKKKCVI